MKREIQQEEERVYMSNLPLRSGSRQESLGKDESWKEAEFGRQLFQSDARKGAIKE